MELIFDRENLWNSMQMVGNVAASRNTLPILANVLIKTVRRDSQSTKDDQIQLAATDLEVGIKSVVEGQIAEPGSITIPAKKLTDIVRELPVSTLSGEPTKVKLAVAANDRVEIECEKARFRIVGLTDEEFPSLPEIGSDSQEDILTLDSSTLCNMFQRTAFAVSTEETRHFLNGIYFRITPDSLRLVATDGKRLAVATKARERTNRKKSTESASLPKEFGVIIPTKAINNIMRIFTDGEEIKVALLENQIVFASQNVTLISRLIEGEYPDYETIISPTLNNEVKMLVDTEQLLSVIRRVSLLANPKTPSIKIESSVSLHETSSVSLPNAGNEISVSASTPELGEAQEKMQVSIEGGSIEIAFNARFVMDVLRNIQSTESLFKFRDSLSPVLVKPSEEEDDYMCVIMPMRL